MIATMGVAGTEAQHEAAAPDAAALDLVGLTSLMARTGGRREVAIALLDGPVAADHPALVDAQIRALRGEAIRPCADSESTACMHGTFAAGMLSAGRGSEAPAICPGCTLLVRPIFRDGTAPSATLGELADAIVECVDAGAHVMNVSAAVVGPSREDKQIEAALDRAATRGVVVVAAAGNQGTLASSAVTRHPWVIPVVACDLDAMPLEQSNLGISVGKRGLMAPGYGVTSLGPGGEPLALGGTSVAAPFVSGTVALLLSEFPDASPAQVRLAVAQGGARRRTSVVPPLLDARAAHERLASEWR
jgi:subtilisin family serine protease